jgi:hypothetical protein
MANGKNAAIDAVNIVYAILLILSILSSAQQSYIKSKNSYLFFSEVKLKNASI